jgi:hypothetical protein
LLFFGVKILKFFDEDPGSGIRDQGWRQFGSGIRDPGWKKVGSGIRDKHPGSATLLISRKYVPEVEFVNYFWNKNAQTVPFIFLVKKDLTGSLAPIHA